MLGKAIWRVLRQFAKAGNIKQTYISRALRLTLLATGTVQAILGGRQPEGMTLPRLMAGVEVEWGSQREMVCG